MEWLAKKSCCNKQDNRCTYALRCWRAIKMIAEVKSDFAVKAEIHPRLWRMRFIVLIVKSAYGESPLGKQL
ncbi:hypothetical protein ACNKHU_13825 [Shigella flexneri]